MQRAAFELATEPSQLAASRGDHAERIQPGAA